MNEDRLRALFEAADRELPGGPLSWAETFARARRARIMRLVAVGVAAATLIAAALLASGRTLFDVAPGPRPVPPAQSPTPEASPRPEETPAPDPHEMSAEVADAQPSVERWISAAARGNAAGMWDEMSPAARAAFDDHLSAFEDFFADGVSEGLGSWDAVEDRAMQVEVLASSGDGASAVVTVFGDRAVEGEREPFAVLALPVRIDSAGDATVEGPFADAVLEAEFVVPPDLTPAGAARVGSSRPTFEVLVDGASEEVYMVTALVPEEPVVRDSGIARLEDAGDGRVRATWRPEGELLSAEWFLSVVARGDDGVLRAAATRYVVE